MNRIRWYGPTVVLLVTVLAVMILGPGMARQIAWSQTDTYITRVKDGLSHNPSLAEMSDAFRKVARVVAPSVVHVQVYSRTPQTQMSLEGIDPEELRRWFNEGDGGDLLERFRRRQQEQEQAPRDDTMRKYDVPQPTGNGSGWVYDDKGHIVTNNHVVENADRIVVRFKDGSERTATVVGADPKTDVAVIKVDGGLLHAATLAPESVEQGDIVFAFGSPFGNEFSMSQGIVSGKGRSIGILRASAGYENFIQTDAAINPGNSGGPLTNIYGQVVGMNTAIATRTGVYNGIGYAIPAPMVQNVVAQLIETGKVSRGFLGIVIDPLDPKLARTFGYEGRGVLVRYPVEGTPAQAAGILRGDIITKVDGVAVGNPDELRNLIAGMPPGTEVAITIFRDGETKDYKMELGELPAEVASLSPTGPVTPGGVEPAADRLLQKLGFERVEALTPDLAKELEIKKFEAGVVVRGVRPSSVAASQGIVAGMIITHVMNEAVDSPVAMVKALRKHDLSKGVRISVLAGDQPVFVLLELDE